jgi:hypothetical protein
MHDVATFRIRQDEVDTLRKTVLRGSERAWPPPPPQAGRGVFFAGYPGLARRAINPNLNEFGIYTAATPATEITDYLITCEFDREEWVHTVGAGLPPENYDLGGLSGAPLLALVEHHVLSWRLAGIIIQARADGNVLLARRADVIRPDGTVE